MARRILKWLGITIGLLLLLVVLAIGTIYYLSTSRFNRTYTIAAAQITIPNDPPSLQRGKHVAEAISKCVDCHGENLGGKVFIDAGPLGRFIASNLTRGQGGVGGRYGDADWIRSIRHGVRPDGSALKFMPSDEFYHLNDGDLGALIAYVKSVPPVDNSLPETTVGPLGRTLFATGQLPLLPAETIDHTAPRPTAPQPGATVEYGRYLGQTGGCLGCHGPGLSGGQVPGTPPDFPPAANITPASIGNWTEQDFFRALREGKKPNGSDINPFMPWMATRKLTDDEIRALYLWVKSVPPKPFGNR